MDKFDRNAQRKALEILYTAYPNDATNAQVDEIKTIFHDEDNCYANLIYLEQHQLIRSGLRSDGWGFCMVTPPSLTHRGIDFIRDDGGLSAILNIQTVKFHDSTIIALEDIIRVTSLPEEKKSVLISKIRELPAEAIKHLTLQLLTPAVLHPQAVTQLIEKVLHLT